MRYEGKSAGGLLEKNFHTPKTESHGGEITFHFPLKILLFNEAVHLEVLDFSSLPTAK